MKDPRKLKVWGKWYSYVLDSIDESSAASDLDLTFEDDRSRIKFFLEQFNEEYNYDYNKQSYPTLRLRISEYLQGLPSSINIHYTYYDIIRLTKEWEGYKSKNKEEYFCNNWFKILATCILQLAARYKIDIYKYQ